MIKALYKITNQINNKVYIGQTLHPNRRWTEHCAHAKAQDDQLPIHLAIAKYGKENFKFEVLEWSEAFDEREAELIAQYNSIAPNGYNVLPGTSHNPVMYEEDHPRNTLSTVIIDQIIAELKMNLISDVELAKKYSTTPKIIADINHGITHKRPNLTYPIRQRKGRTGGIPMEVRMAIIEDLKTTNLSYSQLAEKYHISKSMVGHINHGRFNPIEGIKYPIRGGSNA